MDGAPGGTSEPAPSVIRPTDEASIKLARKLVREARHAALGVLEPDTGHPFASRVLVGTDVDGVPVIIASMLTTHMKALLADPRCSLLVGEPGKGDPLAWPRITLRCEAQKIEHDTESDVRIRSRFLRRHPKAKLYASFRDFAFFRLVPKSASLNGGFGRAYIISSENLIIDSELTDYIRTHELRLIDEIEKSGCNLVNRFTQHYFHEKTGNWYISGLDAEGMDIARKEKVHRVDLPEPVREANGLIVAYSNVLKYQAEN